MKGFDFDLHRVLEQKHKSSGWKDNSYASAQKLIWHASLIILRYSTLLAFN